MSLVSMAEVWPGRWCREEERLQIPTTRGFNGRSMAGSMVPRRGETTNPDNAGFQWPKYGRVDGAYCNGAISRPRMPVSMAEVWPGRWCLAFAHAFVPIGMFQWPKYGRVDGAEPPGSPSSRRSVFQWPKYGRVDGAEPPGSPSSRRSAFQWPKYGRVDGASRTRMDGWSCRQFQWPKYGRVDGARSRLKRTIGGACFNGRSMAGSMVPSGGTSLFGALRNVSMAEVWPGRWCLVPGLTRPPGCEVSMAEVWPGRWCRLVLLRLVNPPNVSMAEVWPGRWCRITSPRTTKTWTFQWPKYGRVDGALSQRGNYIELEVVSMAEVWPGRWCRFGGGCGRKHVSVSMAEVWPGRWCLHGL